MTRVYVQRRGFLYYLGALLVICFIAGAVITFFAWPLYIHSWPMWVRVVVEVAWGALLLTGFITRMTYAGRRRGRHIKAGPGPRDYELPFREDDDPYSNVPASEWMPGKWVI